MAFDKEMLEALVAEKMAEKIDAEIMAGFGSTSSFGLEYGKPPYTPSHKDIVNSLHAIGVELAQVDKDFEDGTYVIYYKTFNGTDHTFKATDQLVQEVGPFGLAKMIAQHMKENGVSAPVPAAAGFSKTVNQVTEKKSSPEYSDNGMNTLRFHIHQRPGTMLLDRSLAPMHKVGVALDAYIKKEAGSPVKPEHEAITFYLLNHAVALISQRTDLDAPLSKEDLVVVGHYQKALNIVGVRFFYYLLLICARECRHFTDHSKNVGLLESMDYPDDLKAFIQTIPDDPNEAPVTFRSNKLNHPIGMYCDILCDAFNKGSWGMSFGGKKWGVVADAMRKYVCGEYSMQLLLDIGWALCHNGGPIFNKGMLYQHYNSTELVKILDCQRGGQIPQLVYSEDSKYVTPTHLQLWGDCHAAVGEAMAGPINWDAVKSAGAVGKTSSKPKKVKMKSEVVAGGIEIMPGQIVNFGDIST